MGVAGLEDGKIFGPPHPRWVDRSLKPGHTPQALASSIQDVLHPIVTLRALIMSPNLVWLVISVAIYTMAPYDLVAGRHFAVDWIMHRIIVNVTVTLTYVSYWYVTLFHFGYADRKYAPNKRPTTATMIHNVWYTTLGAMQWSLWEIVFIYMYSNDYLPFVRDADAFASVGNSARMFFWTAAVPVWREFHFYWAHRLLHVRVLYKYVHSLHHRNVDPEPFSGLAMHPVEHLYYFATVAPALYFTMSPFHMLWNGMHAVISPAAGHSGWEDHWQSDQLHYLHHARFECNYGGGGLPLDKLFGTFREKLGTSQAYQGEARDTTVSNNGTSPAGSNEGSDIQIRGKSDAMLRSRKPVPRQEGQGAGSNSAMHRAIHVTDALPTYQDGVYLGLCALIAVVYIMALRRGTTHPLQTTTVVGTRINAVGLLVSTGPIGGAILLRILFGDGMSMWWPFFKEPLVGRLGLHLVLGLLFTAVPVYHVVTASFGQEHFHFGI